MSYNGWKNRATWNVSLWVSNDQGLYECAMQYVAWAKENKKRITWKGFVEYANLEGDRTGDGYKFDSKVLDTAALAAMLKEMAE